MSDQNRAPEAQGIQIDPQHAVAAYQSKVAQLSNEVTMAEAFIAQLNQQLAVLQQELQQTRLERDTLAEARQEQPTDEVPAKKASAKS